MGSCFAVMGGQEQEAPEGGQTGGQPGQQLPGVEVDHVVVLLGEL